MVLNRLGLPADAVGMTTQRKGRQVKATTRAAIIGGLAGTLCVAVSLAPTLRSQDHPTQPSSVAGNRAAALHDALEPTTTTVPLQAVASTTAPAAPTLEQRVARLEATTTTVPPTTTTTVLTCQEGEILAGNGKCYRTAPTTAPTTTTTFEPADRR